MFVLPISSHITIPLSRSSVMVLFAHLTQFCMARSKLEKSTYVNIKSLITLFQMDVNKPYPSFFD